MEAIWNSTKKVYRVQLREWSLEPAVKLESTRGTSFIGSNRLFVEHGGARFPLDQKGGFYIAAPNMSQVVERLKRYHIEYESVSELGPAWAWLF